MAGKSYMWPVPKDHAEVVLCGSGSSLPCRVVFMMAKHFKLPVDLCGIDFAKHLYSPECLKVNPIHSMPFMVVYPKEGGEPEGINGSEAITTYLANKFRDLIPESFFPADPLANARMMQKTTFICNVAYRATMYQYVYPTLGLMSECQYDICKRDFALQTVEDWAAQKAGQPYFEGEKPSLADFYWYNLWLGNNWVANDDFKLPWKHKDVIDKYPASKKIIQAVEALEGPAAVIMQSLGEGDAPITVINSTGMFGNLAKKMPGNARQFNFTDGGTMHPNFVMYAGDKRRNFDIPLTISGSSAVPSAELGA